MALHLPYPEKESFLNPLLIPRLSMIPEIRTMLAQSNLIDEAWNSTG